MVAVTETLPDLGTAEAVTQQQVVAVALALGLDPNTVLCLRLDADAVTITEWSHASQQPATRVVPVHDRDGLPI